MGSNIFFIKSIIDDTCHRKLSSVPVADGYFILSVRSPPNITNERGVSEHCQEHYWKQEHHRKQEVPKDARW